VLTFTKGIRIPTFLFLFHFFFVRSTPLNYIKNLIFFRIQVVWMMKKYFEGIMTHNIPDCLVIMNANKIIMAILEANQLQIPIISLVDSNF
jgi:hypothetical protein